jgi:hypothetical protein
MDDSGDRTGTAGRRGPTVDTPMQLKEIGVYDDATTGLRGVKR